MRGQTSVATPPYAAARSAYGAVRRGKDPMPARRRTPAPKPAAKAKRPARSAARPKVVARPAGRRGPSITPFLWFDKEAEDAARFYVSVFPGSKVRAVQRANTDYPNGRRGDVLTVDFELGGQRFTALNGGPEFKFNPSISFYVSCKDQAEVDRYWTALSAVPQAEQCGWLVDKFGLSWQIIPDALPRLLASKDRAKAQRVFAAMMGMKKLDVAGLEAAAGGR